MSENKKGVMTLDLATEMMKENLTKFLYYTELARGEAWRYKEIDISDKLYYIYSAIESCSRDITAIQSIITGKKEKIRQEELN